MLRVAHVQLDVPNIFVSSVATGLPEKYRRERRQQYICTQLAHCSLQALINGGSHFCGLLLDEVPT
jgi:hypothetical protein